MRIVVACLIIFQGMGCNSHSSTHGEGVNKMGNIQLAVSLHKTVFMSGEAMKLEATITNNGDSDVSLQISPDWSCSYELRSIDKGIVRYKISSNDLPWRSNPDAPEDEPEYDIIPSGQSQSYDEDIASYVSGEIASGEYELIAQCKTDKDIVKSTPIKVVVQQPQIRRYNMAYCQYSGSFVSVFDHQGADKKTSIYQRVTSTTLADYGVFHPYPTGEEVQDIGTSVYAFPRLKGRWMAFVREGKIGAFLANGPNILGNPSEIPAEMTQLGLVMPGFQMAPVDKERFGPALFMVKGLQDKQAYVQAYTFSLNKIEKKESFRLGNILPEKIMAGFSPARKGREIILAWAEENKSGFRLITQTMTKEGEVASPKPAVIFENDFPLLALELAPISVDEEHLVHALVGPTKVEEIIENGQPQKIMYLSYFRIPTIDTRKKVEEYQVKVPTGSYETPVELWAISGYTTGSLQIIAKHKENILHASAQKFTGWKVLFSGLKQTSNLHLAAALRDYWSAIWIDPAHEIMYEPAPDLDSQ